MSRFLLKEYISQLVEKIRSSYVNDGRWRDTKFNLKSFKNLGTAHIMNVYASDFLEKLGRGSSRAAYLLSSRYVLKIAINKRGLEQNKAELSVYTNPKSKPVVAQIHDYDDTNYKWLISDIVKPVETYEEFENITGIDWDDFTESLLDANRPQTPLSIATRATMSSNELMDADIHVLDHWGKTPDGRLVLLDYGYTGEVYKKYYKGLNRGSVSKTNQPVSSKDATVAPRKQYTVSPSARQAPTKK